MFKYAIAGLMLIAVTGCVNTPVKTIFDEGYEFGDTTTSILHLQAKYCAEADPVKRAVVLALIKSAVPEYPSSGACSSLISLVGQDTVDSLAEKVSDVDIEQAVKDQQKFAEE